METNPRKEFIEVRKYSQFRSDPRVSRPVTMCLPIYRNPAVQMLSVLVKTSSLPSLRSTSHGTFDHVEKLAYGGNVRHDESARFVGGLRGRALVLSMQAWWWPHPVGMHSRAQARKLTLHYVSVCRYRAPRVSSMIRIE